MSGDVTLVVLAAGMGSRYGGMKQLDAVGPGGWTLMDYSVFDARRAGFTDVVFVIRPDMEDAFRPFAAARYGAGDGALRVAMVHQRLDALPAGAPVPPGRRKPWGTAHAVLAAADAVRTPFAVVNADDFYGAAAYEAVAGFLTGEGRTGALPTWAIAGYRLDETTSDAGGVNRGVCRTDSAGWLTHIEEVLDIVPAPDGGFTGRASGGAVALEPAALVSMNIWAFTPAVFDVLRNGLADFLRVADPVKDEFLLPAAIQNAVHHGAARVRVLDPRSRWFGVTYPADRPAVADALRTLVAEGRYPERLW